MGLDPRPGGYTPLGTWIGTHVPVPRTVHLQGEYEFPDGGRSERRYIGADLGLGEAAPGSPNAGLTLGFRHVRSTFRGSPTLEDYDLDVSALSLGLYAASAPERTGLRASGRVAVSPVVWAWGLVSMLTLWQYQPESLDPNEHTVVADVDAKIGYALRRPALRAELGIGLIVHGKPIALDAGSVPTWRGETSLGPTLSLGLLF